MNFKYPSLILFAALLLLAPAPSALATDVNGVATLSQLGRELFYAAILLPEPTGSEETLLESKDTMTLEVKVISSISPRSWSALWTQGVAINNSLESFSANAKDFSEMLNAFRGSLEANDIVRIELIDGDRARVLVNNHILKDNLSPQVFDLCLRSWVGSVPFSSQFKDQLLGKLPPSLPKSVYQEIAPLPGRKAQTLTWSTTNEEPPETATSSKTEIARAEALTIPDTLAPEVPPFNETIELQAPPDPVVQKSSGTGDDLPGAEASADRPIKIEPPDVVDYAGPPSERSKSIPAPQSDSKQPAIGVNIETRILPESEPAEVTAESLIAQQAYIQSVRREIYAVTEYPLSAMRRKLEGTVLVSITLDRSGDLISVEIIEEADFSGFNKAILQAVQSAAPFTIFPADMEGEQFTITTPFSFRIAV